MRNIDLIRWLLLHPMDWKVRLGRDESAPVLSLIEHNEYDEPVSLVSVRVD